MQQQEANQMMRQQYRKQFLQAIQERKIEQALVLWGQLQQLNIDGEQFEENIYNLAGLCYYQMGKWKEARACFLVSYTINSSDENKAAQYLKQLTEEVVEHFEEINRKALEAIAEKNFKKSEKLFKQNQKIKATIQNDLLLGLCQYGRKRKLGALLYFKDALEKDPSHQIAIRLIRSLKINTGGVGHLLWKTIMRY